MLFFLLVMELQRYTKNILHPIIPSDPTEPEPIPPTTVITKGRQKTDSTKRDKSNWEHIAIAVEKMKKSSGSCSGSKRGLGSASQERERPPCAPNNGDRG